MTRTRPVRANDCSRLTYSEILDDEKKETAAGFWERAHAFFAAHDIVVRRVLTDNGSCYRSRVFVAALDPITHKRTRPYRPQTNGKVREDLGLVLHRTGLTPAKV